ncbi:mitochondrial phosphate carrier protein [Thecaphora frezii]|nr:putative mitochondrial carrier [Thecaphora frezii]
MATSTTAGTPAAPDYLKNLSEEEVKARLQPAGGSASPAQTSEKASKPSSSSTAPSQQGNVPRLSFPDYTLYDYVQFLSAGGLCATITHGALTPIDVVKTRLQLEPKGSKYTMVSMARNIVANEGPRGLLTGFGPTAVGYLVQGGAKFCGYEWFKKHFSELAGSPEKAAKYRQLIFLGGASAAEFIASTLLTPLEAARIRLVSQRGYATGLVTAVTRMAKEEGLRGFYAGYAPILCKQIPYAVGQFVTNEWAHSVVDRNISKEKQASFGKVGEVGINLGCGMVAGVAAAILSHPADTLLSKINRGGGGNGSAMSKLVTLAKETGPIGIWAGLGTRILMTAVLVSGQFVIYGQLAPAPKKVDE